MTAPPSVPAVRRAFAAQEAVELAEATPCLPPDLRVLLPLVLADRRSTSDALLILADALAEVEQSYRFRRRALEADAVAAVAGLLRDTAPAYARPVR